MSRGQVRRFESGGLVNRNKTIKFTFNGKPYTGFEGDTLASALMANDVRVVSRSFKFHRPRGVLSAGVEESNALLGVDTGSGIVPISKATMTPLVDGLKAESQNCYPSLRFDVGRVLDYSREMWPAGFYNKVFKWPSWHTFEPLVRKMAGLGRLPSGSDNARYRHMNTFCDVLVVGAGPVGLQAAITSGKRGDEVILVEQDEFTGGSLLFDQTPVDGQPSESWLERARQTIDAMDNVRVMTQATVAGYYDHNVLTIHDRSCAYRGDRSVETFWKVRAQRVVLATGAIEQPMLFGNNDLPGVMLAGAVHKYAARYAVECGDCVVGLVNNDVAWRSLIALADIGVKVAAIIDVREVIDSELVNLARGYGVIYESGATPVTAQGSGQVRAIRYLNSSGAERKIACDVIAMSGGLNPTLHLYSQAGGKLTYDDALACFVPHECRQAVEVIGAANGRFSVSGNFNIARRKPADFSSNAQWVDYLHDVTVSDIELAVRENYVSVEHLKRYTTTGMSVDQGKTSNLNALTLLGSLTDRAPGDVGTTTFRPQFTPVTMGAIAGNRRGDFYSPPRYLPVHQWHVDRGAAFEDYGEWKRPAFYGRDRDASIRKEALAVRNSAGLFDGSPLGKIEAKGPDAAEFLNRIYVNKVRTLLPGKVRYGLMLNENGIIIDDGVFVRLADDHFLINTTSGNADRIAGWLEEWHQCEWPDLKFILSPVTSQWAVATVAGPKSRQIIQALPGMIDLATDRLPHMSFASGRLQNGTRYRIQRVSYTGECSYELSVPTSKATETFEEIWQLGEKHGLSPIGIEAILLLRTEKGFLHVGVDTDGSTNPYDVGFGRIVENKEGDFIGARSLKRANDLRRDRRQLVGFEVSGNQTVNPGAHIISVVNNQRRSEGFVTSAYFSPTLSKTVGLGLLERGADRMGENIVLLDDGQEATAQIADPAFYDPEAKRMRE